MAKAEQEERWEPRTWDELFPGRFLKSSHFNGKELEIRIVRIYNTTIDGELAQVAVFEKVPGITQVEWGLNKTNGLCMKALFGETIRDWFGKRVVLYEGRVEHGREKGKPCIRICACPDVEKDVAVVVDFHTKRIKPFTIRVRAGGPKGAQGQRQAASATDMAKRLAERLRQSDNADQYLQLGLDIEAAVTAGEITREESKALMASVVKRSTELAERESANVIS